MQGKVSMSDIPAEVFAGICDNLTDVADILALRLTNRDLRDKCQYTFERKWFHTIKVILHPISLDMLVAIADRPEYAKHVKRLIIGAELINCNLVDQLVWQRNPVLRRNYGNLCKQQQRMIYWDWIRVLHTAIPRLWNLERLDLENLVLDIGQDRLWRVPTPKACGMKRVQELVGVDRSRYPSDQYNLPFRLFKIQSTGNTERFIALCVATLHMRLRNVDVGIGGTVGLLSCLPKTIGSKFARAHYMSKAGSWCSRLIRVSKSYGELILSFNDSLQGHNAWSLVSLPPLSKLTLAGGVFPADHIVRLLKENQTRMSHIHFQDDCCVVSADREWLPVLKQLLAMPKLVDLGFRDVLAAKPCLRIGRLDLIPVYYAPMFTRGMPVHWKNQDIRVRLQEAIACGSSHQSKLIYSRRKKKIVNTAKVTMAF